MDTGFDESLNWKEYLSIVGGEPAKPEWFKQSKTPPVNHFKPNYLLEAADLRSAATETSGSRRSISLMPPSVASMTPSLAGPPPPPPAPRRFRAVAYSLASVVECYGPRLRLRLIGTDDKNDMWVLVDSDQIQFYPSGHELQPPFGFMNNHTVWHRTLKKAVEGGPFADKDWFHKSPPDPGRNMFLVGSKLEAMDRRNPQLICPATVMAVNGDHILVSFDGWKGAFDYWTRHDSRDLFPIGWSNQAGIPVQQPGPGMAYSPKKTISIKRKRKQSPMNERDTIGRSPTRQAKLSRLSEESPTKATDSVAPKDKLPLDCDQTTPKSMSSSSKSMPSSTKDMSSSAKSMPSSTKDMSSFTKSIPSSTKDMSSSAKSTPSSTKDMSSFTESMPSSTKSMPSSSKDMSSSTKSMPSSSKDTKSSTKPIFSSTKDISATNNNDTETTRPDQSAVPVKENGQGSHDAVSPALNDHEVDNTSQSTSKLKKKKKKKHSKSKSPFRSIPSSPYRPGEGDGVEVESLIAMATPIKVKTEKDVFAAEVGMRESPSHLVPLSHEINNNIAASSSQYHSTNSSESTVPGFDDSHAFQGGILAGLSAGLSESLDDREDSEPALNAFQPHQMSSQLFHHAFTTSQSESVPPPSRSLGSCNSPQTSQLLVVSVGSAETTPAPTPHKTDHFNTPRHHDHGDSHQRSRARLGQSSFTPETACRANSGHHSPALPSSLSLTLPHAPSSKNNFYQVFFMDNVKPPYLNQDPNKWSSQDVVSFILERDHTLHSIAPIFLENEIDGQALLLLNVDSLRSYMGVKLGPALKIEHLINLLKRDI